MRLTVQLVTESGDGSQVVTEVATRPSQTGGYGL